MQKIILVSSFLCCTFGLHAMEHFYAVTQRARQAQAAAPVSIMEWESAPIVQTVPMAVTRVRLHDVLGQAAERPAKKRTIRDIA